MSDAEVRFKREDAEGLVAVGTYLSDAAKRFGVKFEPECVPAAADHNCAVHILKGGELLSEMTAAEKDAKLDKGWRLACHAKTEKAGEIEVMTKEKPVTPEEEKEKAEDYRKRFEELPLEKKMAELVRLEGIALSETLSFVINSPYQVADKIMGFMAEFGFKMDADKKAASKPEEHRTNGASAEEKVEEQKDAKGDA